MKYRSQFDMMTQKPIPSLIIKLGIPTMISMFVTTLYNMADSYFVGQINTSASGATSVVLGLMAILQAMGFMFGHGSGSIISRNLGQKDIDSARRYSATGFYSALFIGFIILIFGSLLLTPLMILLGVSSCVMNNILRYEGRAFFAMIGLTSGGIVNIFLDALFMQKMNMGILGAGLATAISQYLSWFILLSMFLLKKTQTSLSFKYAKFDIKTLGNIITTGLPSLARQGLASISTMLLNNAAGVYGDAAIAAMGIAGRVSMFIFSAALGIGQGFQPVAGFNFGAKKYDRVRQGFFFTLFFGSVMLGIAAIALFFNAGICIQVFRDDPEVITIGIPALRAQCIGLFFVPFQVCNNMMFQSIGYKFNATFLSSLRNGLFFIPVLLLSSWIFGLAGIQVAQAVADVLTSLTCIPFTVSFFKKISGETVQDHE